MNHDIEDISIHSCCSMCHILGSAERGENPWWLYQKVIWIYCIKVKSLNFELISESLKLVNIRNKLNGYSNKHNIIMQIPNSNEIWNFHSYIWPFGHTNPVIPSYSTYCIVVASHAYNTIYVSLMWLLIEEFTFSWFLLLMALRLWRKMLIKCW